MSDDLEYKIVCGLALKKLHEDYTKILSSIDLSGDERFIPVPIRLVREGNILIRNAKAIEYICVVKHPSNVSDNISIVTDQVIKTFEER